MVSQANFNNIILILFIYTVLSKIQSLKYLKYPYQLVVFILLVFLLICNYFMNIKNCFFVNSKISNFISDLSLSSIQEIQQKNQSTNQYALNCYQIALYSDLSSVAKKIQFLGYDKDFCSIFGIYSFSIDKKDIKKLFLALIRIFQENQLLNQEEEDLDIKQPYKKTIKTKGITLILFTQGVSLRKKIFSSNQDEPHDLIDFSFFKNEVLKKLPLKSLIQLNKILVCHPGFLNKSLSYIPSFGTLNSFLQKYIEFADSIFQLCVVLGPLLNCQDISKRVLEFDRGKIWKNLYTQTDKVRSLQELSYFQMCQSSVNSSNSKNHIFYLQSIQKYELNSKNIPKLLKALLKQIQEKHSKYQGIFRKACDESELFRMQSQILNATKNRIKIKEILFKYQAQTIASCIKKIFSSLRHPIISYQVYQKIAKLDEHELFQKKIDKKSDNIKLKQGINTKIQQNENNENKAVVLINSKECPKENMCKTTFDNLNLINTNDHEVKKTLFMKNRDFFQNLSKNNQQQTHLIKNICKVQQLKHEINETPYLISTTFQKQNIKNFFIGCQPNSSIKFNSNGQQQFQFPNKNTKLSILIDQLRGTNQYEVFKYTLKFLSKVILVNQKHNLMSAYNLGVVFVPCFFRSKNQNYRQLILSSKFVQVVKTLIFQYDQYFQN